MIGSAWFTEADYNKNNILSIFNLPAHEIQSSEF